MNSVVVCTGFPRSGTSLSAQLLADAGLSLGQDLMSSSISNPDGHFEDRRLIELHMRLLQEQGSSWLYHGEVDLEQDHEVVQALSMYVEQRDRHAQGLWGCKDPSASLFLPSWQTVLEERGCFLLLFRHWAYCLDSLYRRHARTIAHQLRSAAVMRRQAQFWRDAQLAAKMWLSYNQSILSFARAHPKCCVLVNQEDLLAGFDLLGAVNQKFGLELVSTTPTILKGHFAQQCMLEGDLERIPHELRDALNEVLRELQTRAASGQGGAQRSAVHTAPLPASVQRLAKTWKDIWKDFSGRPKEEFAAEEPAIMEVAPSVLCEQALGEYLTAVVQRARADDPERIKAAVAVVRERGIEFERGYEFTGRALLLCEEFRDAAVLLEKAVMRQPTAIAPLLHLGECYRQQQLSAKARSCYLQAQKHHPAHPTLEIRLGQLAMNEGDFADAHRHFLEALRLIAPEDTRRLNWARTNLIRCSEQLLPLEQLVREAKELFQQSGDDIGLGLEYSRVLMRHSYHEGKALYNSLVRRFVLGHTAIQLLPLAQTIDAIPELPAQESLLQHIVLRWLEVLPDVEGEEILAQWFSAVAAELSTS